MIKVTGYAARHSFSGLKPYAFEREEAGALEPVAPVDNMQMALKRRMVAGSLIGKLAGTQEVLDFCAEHDIGPEIEMIRIQDIDDACSKVEKGDVRFRYVIDMASPKEEIDAA
ncbi:hypothetical protein G4G28_20040 [Massilia sp. Dwa41.01b]|uniref:hypothetical protein n=1 Tax=unclassified Massilia TaxID=2609279 RepID=UPI00160367B6|nr:MULTISPECIES: hypothetical protein [unclassified Massilia]QNA90218.1 hypothetical protein G4G28_20040 [Massilia sp. Dwa41.01b]QNB01105.1 hypothetical protein G4G31_23640 [Massilia sp. Se16.2.3]